MLILVYVLPSLFLTYSRPSTAKYSRWEYRTGYLMLDRDKKQSLIKKFKTHDNDTGSPQVQIAILTEEIRELTEHLKSHKKDFSSRRGLFRKVNLRRKLLMFLHKIEPENYEALVKKLKLKRISEPQDKKDILEEEALKAEEDEEEPSEEEK